MTHIANISLAVGCRLEWNAEKEEFINDPRPINISLMNIGPHGNWNYDLIYTEHLH